MKLSAHCKEHTAPQCRATGEISSAWDRHTGDTAGTHAGFAFTFQCKDTKITKFWLTKAPWLGKEQPTLLQYSASLHRRCICSVEVRCSFLVKKRGTDTKQQAQSHRRTARTRRECSERCPRHHQPRGSWDRDVRPVPSCTALRGVTGTGACSRMEEQTLWLWLGHCPFKC